MTAFLYIMQLGGGGEKLFKIVAVSLIYYCPAKDYEKTKWKEEVTKQAKQTNKTVDRILVFI